MNSDQVAQVTTLQPEDFEISEVHMCRWLSRCKSVCLAGTDTGDIAGNVIFIEHVTSIHCPHP